MKLYLVQHAKAVSEQVDPQRPLSEEGRLDVQKVATFIKPLGLCIDYLWHSQKKRAIETAEILAEVLKINNAKIARDGLAPNDDVKALKDELLSQRDIMIVGHLPFVSKLASLLLAGAESANVVAFKNAGIVCLNCSDNGHWQIDWMITPELIV